MMIECVLCENEFESDDDDDVVCAGCVEGDPNLAREAKVDAQLKSPPLWIEDGRLFDTTRLEDREMRLSQED